MSDRETVMSWLECLAQDDWRDYHSDSEVQEIAMRALALLKEQEDHIGVLQRAIEQMPKPTKLLDVFGDGYAKIVRCQNCKYGEPTKNGAGDDCIQCNNDDLWLDGNLNFPDWFCADGERR